MTQQPAVAWRAILPVKVLAQAKSRMAGGPRTVDLAFAFFQDTLTAVQQCPSVSEVAVVTGDSRIADWAGDHACNVVSDEGHPGINEAVRWAVGSRPHPTPTAVIVSDLPCLTADALGAALELALDHPTSFVADADGTGTTIWLCAAGEAVDPRFGGDSRAAHRLADAVDLVAAYPGRAPALAPARRDVDTGTALDEALRLGLGRHTLRVLSSPRGAGTSDVMVTVVTSDRDTLRVVDEDGGVRTVPWAMATAAGLIHARPGQRLAAVLLPTGDIAALRLP